MRTAKPQIKGDGSSGNELQNNLLNILPKDLVSERGCQEFKDRQNERLGRKNHEDLSKQTDKIQQEKSCSACGLRARKCHICFTGDRKWYQIGHVSRTTTAVIINVFHVQYLCVYFCPYSYTPLFWGAQRAPASKKLQAIIFPKFQFKLFCHSVLAHPSHKECHSKEIPVS